MKITCEKRGSGKRKPTPSKVNEVTLNKHTMVAIGVGIATLIVISIPGTIYDTVVDYIFPMDW